MTTPSDNTIRKVMAELGRRGAAARAAKYSPEELSEMQRKAAVKRWRAHNKKKREKTS